MPDFQYYYYPNRAKCSKVNISYCWIECIVRNILMAMNSHSSANTLTIYGLPVITYLLRRMNTICHSNDHIREVIIYKMSSVMRYY